MRICSSIEQILSDIVFAQAYRPEAYAEHRKKDGQSDQGQTTETSDPGATTDDGGAPAARSAWSHGTHYNIAGRASFSAMVV